MKRNNGEEYALLLCNQKCGEKQRISIKWMKWIKWKHLRKSVFNISGHQFALYARRQFGSVYTGVYNVFIFIIRSTVGMKAKNTHSIEQSIFTRSKREIESKKKKPAHRRTTIIYFRVYCNDYITVTRICSKYILKMSGRKKNNCASVLTK